MRLPEAPKEWKPLAADTTNKLAPLEAGNRRYFILFLLAVVFAALVPFFFALMAAPAGSAYLGFQYNTDDHMVYAAWMRQAMDGRLLMDNRFAVDTQPGLTVHLYYFVLGLIAKITGLSLATTLARAFFTGLFVYLAYRLVRRMTTDIYTTKLALALAVFGGGIGFLVWHTFGVAIVRANAEWMRPLTNGSLPTDIWQPEGFVFPSMLTNGLFMVSLCLIVGTLICVLNARDSWKPVLPGFLCFAVLMNIHSYDVLIVTIVLIGFLVTLLAQGRAKGLWIARAVVIGLGAIPAALWFLYVLRNDPVFQSRAATETFSPNFRALLVGYLPLIGLALAGVALPDTESDRRRQWAGLAIVGLIFGGLYVAAGDHSQGYFLNLGSWLAVVAGLLAALFLLARKNDTWNLLLAWALLGMVALYFPALFQRKLAMGLSVPWAILAGLGFSALVGRADRHTRNLATVLALLILAGTSFRWVVREADFTNRNVSNTTVHPVYLSRDAQAIVEYLNQRTEGRTIIVAMPGVANPEADANGQAVVDSFRTPIVPDLNPILAGLTGVYAYAGHWSETPDYLARRDRSTRIFLSQTSDADRRTLLAETGANYLVAPVPEVFGGGEVADLRPYGQLILDGSQFRLIRLR